jgi:hypothetical protein
LVEGFIYCLLERHSSELAKKSYLKIILPEDIRPGILRRFYTRAAYLLSPLLVKLAKRLTEIFVPA